MIIGNNLNSLETARKIIKIILVEKQCQIIAYNVYKILINHDGIIENNSTLIMIQVC